MTLTAHPNVISLAEWRRMREQRRVANQSDDDAVRFVMCVPPVASHPAAQALLAGLLQGMGERDGDEALIEAGKRLARAAQKDTVALRVLVCGGRDFHDRGLLNDALDRLHAERGFSLVIAGGARGADTLAEEWAKARNIPCEIYHADWEGLGRKAGPIRNARMLVAGKPDLVVGFPGGRGTAHMVRIAREAGVEAIEI
jgi:hypothetical protein